FTPAEQEFEIGKAIKMIEGRDVTLFATGHLVWESIRAVQELEKEGISVELIDLATIKPLDEKAVLESAAKTGAVVCAEEHLIAGGVGELISGVLCRHTPCPVEFVAVDDVFGKSGTPAELMKAYGLDAVHIAEAVRRVLRRK
ncbi:MAG: transketolase family protein, partial [Alistipes sp.]|nr:transketolase family protein [Candidatus Minthomonas equi]